MTAAATEIRTVFYTSAAETIGADARIVRGGISISRAL